MKKLLIVIIGVLIIAGCDSQSTTRRVSRGAKLSDAMNKASDTHRASRRVDGSVEEVASDDDIADVDTLPGSNEVYIPVYTNPQSENIVVPGLCTTNSKSSKKAEPKSAYRGGGLLGATVFCYQHFSQYFETSFGADFTIGFSGSSRGFNMIRFGMGVMPLTTDNPLYNSIYSVIDLHATYEYEYYIFGENKYTGLYLSVGGGMRHANWGYKNAVYMDVTYEDGTVGTEKVELDGLSGISALAGVGWTFVNTQNFRCGLSIKAGATLYWINTASGMDNDLFPADAYVSIQLELLGG